ncbi:hypothetical protein NZK35_09290 [Stieleria sp. ICT_E10.1]|uniref:hypothetical protein n=1 Tax=Stieleria sedimenti TaxID=2976331 RepID=UPI00217F4989|nr:hypothetical protein [Stieleria sedimenti]MCS7466836.1 hypothetical protein [Stieleria sedimenti]
MTQAPDFKGYQRMRRKQIGWIAALLSASIWHNTAGAEHLFWGRARTCNRGSIRPYNYVEDQTRRSISIDLVDTVGVPRTLEAGSDADIGNVAGDQATRARAYHPDQRRFEIDGLRVEDIAVELQDSGSLATSCRLTFSGGPERALDGTNVTLRLRALQGGRSGRASSALSPAIWESTYELWVPTNSVKSVPIVRARPTNRAHSRTMVYAPRQVSKTLGPDHPGIDLRLGTDPLLKEQFDEIRVFQLIVERHRDQ